MIIARCSITVYTERDIQSATWYFKLQSSTAAPPEKPTTLTPPEGWSTTEPTYTEGSTNSLYVVERTIFTDGDFSYSDVSLSSSYEAAKTAYNKAVNAETVAGGKNSVFYQSAEPSTTGRTVGDIWYDTGNGNAMHKFDGTQWVLTQFGTNAIVAGSITTAKLNAQDVYTNFLLVNFLAAAQAEISSLSAITADIGTVTAGVLRSSNYSYSSGNYSTAGMMIDLNTGIIRTPKTALLADGSIHATSADITGTIRSTNDNNTITLSSDSSGAFVTAKNSITSIEMIANADGSVGLYELPYPFTGTPDEILVRTGSAIYTSFNFSCDGSVYASSGVGVNKTSGQDGNAGFWANSAGNIYLTGGTSAGGTIYFYFNKATSSTSYIGESASGVLTTNAYFAAKDYSGSTRRVVTSYSTDGQRVAGIGSANTVVQVSGQWGTAGGSYSSRNVTTSSSDIRLKRNIKPSTVDALALINQIQVREFDWTDLRAESHQSIGMVADELELLDNKLAVGGGFDDNGNMNIKSVDTFYLVGYLVKAVQELTAELKELKGEA